MITRDPVQPVSLLLAEDDKDDRFFFKNALSKISVPTVLWTVENGSDLMIYLKQHKKNLPDALFLDLNMPRKNGFECLAEIKADKDLKKLPVIMNSTSLPDTAADTLYSLGAHYYMRKTNLTDLGTLLHKVLTMLQNNAFVRPHKEQFILEVKKL
ncbi:MAG TPA: response regulator [Bacteroidia bacterium]|jgi:CheY-like chemotaxis protein|nr:response regulator [Bacteroidia bacterium]